MVFSSSFCAHKILANNNHHAHILNIKEYVHTPKREDTWKCDQIKYLGDIKATLLAWSLQQLII